MQAMPPIFQNCFQLCALLGYIVVQAKMDAAQSIKLKDSAKAKAVTAKDLFDSAGISQSMRSCM